MSIFKLKNKKDNDKERKKQVENKEISKPVGSSQVILPKKENNYLGTNPMESIPVDVYKSQIPYAFDQVISKDPIPKYKRLVDKKLTVVLIENTDETVS